MKLAIFKVNQLGDNVVFLPIVQALRRLYPQWDLFLFTSPVAADLFSADLTPSQMCLMRTPDFNRAWRDPRRLLALAARARRKRFDATLMAHDQGNVAHLLARAAGGRTRIGIRPEFIKVPGGLTELAPVDPHLNITLLNWEITRVLLDRIGGQGWADFPPPPDLRHLRGDALPVPGRIVIHPGASTTYKRWPVDRFQALAIRLASQFEVQWIDPLEAAPVELPETIRRLRPDSLAGLVQALGSASLLVANNSGPMNVACAMGLPAVVINGPSHYVWDPFWYPERYLMLRDTTLPCLPCDTETRLTGICTNTFHPLACLDRWSVHDLHARCCEWLEKWAGLMPAAPPSPQ